MFDLLRYRIKRPYHFLKTGLREGMLAQLRYGFPAKKLKVIAITGTDGKTTTSTLVYHILKTGGKKVALLSTVGAYLGNSVLETGLHVTSPQPNELHRLFKHMAEEGCEYVVLEVTSHAMHQYRTWGVTPEIAGLTNITNEHLDYHVNFDEYVQAKRRLLRQAKTVVLNNHDSVTHLLNRLGWRKKQRVLTYSATSDLAQAIEAAIQQRFSQQYNHLNSRLATVIAQLAGVSDTQIAKAITTFPAIPGRMEEVVKKPVRVLVDFAHTANALENALTAARRILGKNEKLIVVFGCAGLRDASKRPVMGEVGARLADLAIFTADDPRTEDIWSIFRQMKSNLGILHNKVLSIPDRREAITMAIKKIAKTGDTVLICGKGHEKSLCIGTTEFPWHDPTVIREIVAKK